MEKGREWLGRCLGGGEELKGLITASRTIFDTHPAWVAFADLRIGALAIATTKSGAGRISSYENRNEGDCLEKHSLAQLVRSCSLLVGSK